jgi:uncharacterized protein
MQKPSFELVDGKNGETFWHLKAANGEIVAQSEGYTTREGALRGVEAVKRGVLAALGIDVRDRILMGTTKITEVVGGTKDGSLDVDSSDVKHYVAVDADYIDDLPL